VKTQKVENKLLIPMSVRMQYAKILTCVVMYKQLKQIIDIINCDDFKIINSDHFNLQNLQLDKNIPKSKYVSHLWYKMTDE
jgi:hypothetical protein